MFRGALALLLVGLPACVEIDPSYADGFTTTTEATATDTMASASASTTDAASDGSTGPATCDCALLEVCQDGTCTAPARILYINLDGVTTTFGNADASQNVQNLYQEFATTWDPYGADEATRQALLSAIAEHWAPFPVVVTDMRPAAGPYVMAVVSASPRPAGFEGFALFAYPDCGDVLPQDIVFVLASPSDGAGAGLHADWVSSTIGRALGLRRTEAPDDLMGYGSRFADACNASTDTACPTAHPALCGDDPMQQNSYGELAALLGTRE